LALDAAGRTGQRTQRAEIILVSNDTLCIDSDAKAHTLIPVDPFRQNLTNIKLARAERHSMLTGG